MKRLILVVAVLFRVVDTFKLFDMVWVLMKDNEPRMVSALIYKMALRDNATGPSCAAAYVVLVIVIAVSNVLIRYLNRSQLKA
jgi:multiple sugar transport system permease protein